MDNREIRKNLDSKYEKEKLDGLKRLIAVSLLVNVAVSGDSQQFVNFEQGMDSLTLPCDPISRPFNLIDDLKRQGCLRVLPGCG